MKRLAENKCEACRAGAPLVTSREIKELMPSIPEWNIIDVDDTKHLSRSYCFKDFAASLVFTNEIGAIAEAEGHHPSILTEYGLVTVSWWTHAIGGLHLNDFIMAAKSDEFYNNQQGTGPASCH